eukprot:05632.XXX_19485_19643_1 [CDS] Oithona nana genome sequencing.
MTSLMSSIPLNSSNQKLNKAFSLIGSNPFGLPLRLLNSLTLDSCKSFSSLVP